MRRSIASICAVLTLAMTSTAFACPFCKDATDAAAQGGKHAMVGAGFNMSILLMLGGLVIAMGIATRAIVKAIRET